MSDMSWKDLRDLDCATLRNTGNLWKSYTAAMVEQTERLRSDVVEGHLRIDNYESETADTVREQIGLINGRFEDDLSDYADIRLANTMLEAADAIEAEQQELRELIGLIEDHEFEIEGDRHEYEVNPSAALHRAIWALDPPQWLCDRVGIDKSSAWYDIGSQAEALVNIDPVYDSAKELAGQYQDWLRAVMSRTHDADDDAAAALSAMREQPPELPPQFGATYDDRIGDYKTALSEEVASEMEAIADGDSDMSPQQVNEWWDDLTDTEREALIAEHPEWVGPTDGIPTEARDAANRVVLANEIGSLGEQITSLQEEADSVLALGDLNQMTRYDEIMDEIAELEEDRSGLTALQDRITDDGNPAVYSDTNQPYFLLGFGTEGSGQAIVSIGNPDTAANVNTYVPGTTADVGGAAGGLMDRTETMAYDAYALGSGGDTATVLWLGYDAPDSVLPEATESKWAEDAADDLESFTQGIRATSDDANLTLTGHSYGTTVIGTAAANEGVEADNLVLVASPGASVDTADALGVGSENVYATTNDLDVIQFGAVHGGDPTSEEFGGSSFQSDPGSPSANNHSTYWDDTNQIGRDSMAAIVTGSGQ